MHCLSHILLPYFAVTFIAFYSLAVLSGDTLNYLDLLVCNICAACQWQARIGNLLGNSLFVGPFMDIRRMPHSCNTEVMNSLDTKSMSLRVTLPCKIGMYYQCTGRAHVRVQHSLMVCLKMSAGPEGPPGGAQGTGRTPQASAPGAIASAVLNALHPISAKKQA